jgi:hypothetical protein
MVKRNFENKQLRSLPITLMEISLPSSMLWNRAALVRWCQSAAKWTSICTKAIKLPVHILEWSVVKSCPVAPELHPSFDDASSSSPGWWYLQSHEILLNKGREILRLSMKCTKLENIYNYSTHKQQHQWLIEGVQEERKKSTGRTQFSTKFGTKLRFISYPVEAQFYFFFLCLKKISSLMWPNGGFRCRLFLTLVCWIKY